MQCNNFIVGNKFQFKNGPLFKVKSNMDCSSKNLLYVIKCEGCGEDYIGETGNELRKRMTVHRHYYFTLFPFYKFADNTTELERIVKESEFITKYRPKLNK